MNKFQKILKKSILFSGLGRTLLFSFLAIALIPVMIVSFVSYNKAHQSLEKEICNSLEIAAVLTTNEIHSYFTKMIEWLRFQSETATSVNFFSQLFGAWNASAIPLKKFVRSNTWTMIVTNLAGDINQFKRSFNLYDVLLITNDGDIIYTVANKSDLGSNVFSENSVSKFSKACQRTIKKKNVSFSDYERYTPSDNLIVGFITAPIINTNGNMIGLMAFQFQIDAITQIMKGCGDNRKTSEVYLVGQDLTLRSGLRLDSKKALIDEKIITAQTKRLERLNDVDKSTAQIARAYKGPFGRTVLGVLQTIKIENITFAVIAEIDIEDAFAPIEKLRKWIILVSALTILVIFCAAIVMARLILRPVTDLSINAKKVKGGDFNQLIKIKAKNEIGELSESFNQMLTTIQKGMQDNLREIENKRRLENIAQSALKTTEMILQTLPFGVIIIGKDKKIRKINEYANNLIGKSSENLIGSICHENICPAMHGMCPVLDLHNKVDKSERILLGPDKIRIPILKTVLPITIDNEEVLLECFIDIRELKEKEEEIKKNMKALEETNRQLELLISSSLEREIRMVKLKQEVNTLLKEKGEKDKYTAPSEVLEKSLDIDKC